MVETSYLANKLENAHKVYRHISKIFQGRGGFNYRPPPGYGLVVYAVVVYVTLYLSYKYIATNQQNNYFG